MLQNEKPGRKPATKSKLIVTNESNTIGDGGNKEIKDSRPTRLNCQKSYIPDVSEKQKTP